MQRNHISIIAILIMSVIPSLMMAEAPAGYYASLKGKSESALKTALYQIINPHTQVSSYTALPEYFKKTDVRPGTNYWWDMYSDLDVPTNITFGTYMNREHSLPKSWWGGLTNIPGSLPPLSRRGQGQSGKEQLSPGRDKSRRHP